MYVIPNQKKKLMICMLWANITLNIKNNMLTTNKPLLYYYIKLYYIYIVHAHIHQIIL